jgi:hypothetical protein
MAFQMNQFKLTDIAGEVMNVNPSTISVRISKDFATTLKAGDVVKLVASEAGDAPVVTEAASGDAGFGVILFNAKKATYAAYDMVEIALAGSIVGMVASTGMNRAQLVSWNSVSHKIQSTSGNYIGYTLDIASASGDIVRVFVQPKLS